VLRKLFTPATARLVMKKHQQDYDMLQLPEPEWISQATGEWFDSLDQHACRVARVTMICTILHQLRKLDWHIAGSQGIDLLVKGCAVGTSPWGNTPSCLSRGFQDVRETRLVS
jgi:hypothetical protein